ncbi:MAG: M56 family metallopeptidase [Bacteroidales bacterium]
MMIWANNILAYSQDDLVTKLTEACFQTALEGLLIWGIAALIYQLIPHVYSRLRYVLLVATMLALPAVLVLHIAEAEAVVSPKATINRTDSTQELSVSTAQAEPYATHYTRIKVWTNEAAQKYAPFFLFLWILGLLFFTLRIIWQTHELKYVRKHAQPVKEARILQLVATCKAKLAIIRKVSVYSSDKVLIPFASGVIRPVIMLPVSIITQIPQEQLETIILHELAHIKRYDFLVQLLQRVVEALFFFHPLVWWCSARLHDERECICDDIVLKHTPNKADYARALLSANKHAQRIPKMAIALTNRKTNTISYRIKRMIMKPNSYPKRMQWLVPIIMLAFVLLTLAFTHRHIASAETTTNDAHSRLIDHPAQAALLSENEKGTIASDTLKKKKKDNKSSIFYNQLVTTTKSIDEDKNYKIQLQKGEVKGLWLNDKEIPASEYHKHQEVIDESKEDLMKTEESISDIMGDLKEMHLETIFEGLATSLEALAVIDWEGISELVGESVEEVDMDAIEQDVYDALDEADSAEVQQELARTFRILDSIDTKSEVNRAFSEIDREEIRNEIREGMREARMEMHKEMSREWDTEQLREQMQHIREQMHTADPEDIRREMRKIQEQMHQMHAELRKEAYESRNSRQNNVSPEEKLKQMEKELETLENMQK